MDVLPRRAVAELKYRPDIDGLRAVAATVVVGAHAASGLLPGGVVGVDIFFVISGYLISGIIIRGLQRQTFSCVDFYVRRTKRIFPALIVVLATVWLFGWLIFLPDEHRRLGWDIAAGSAFVLNFKWYANIDQLYRGVPLLDHLWTLGVEEQFYLLWPWFLMAIWRLKRARFALILSAIALSLTADIVTASHDLLASYLLPWNRLWELALGAALAHGQLEGLPELTRLTGWTTAKSMPRQRLIDAPLNMRPAHARLQLCGVLGTGLVILPITGLVPGVIPLIGLQMAAASGTVLVIAAGPRSYINRYVLSSTPMVHIGLISYPLYLWHLPLLGFARQLNLPHLEPDTIVVAVAASFVLAFLTYRYVELPVRSVPSSMVTASALCILMLSCGMIGYQTSRIPTCAQPDAVADFVRATAEDWLTNANVDSWTDVGDEFPTIGTGSRTVLFIGDSSMQQFYPRIERILSNGAESAHSATFAVRDWCAPAAVDVVVIKESARLACRSHLRRATEYARQPRVDTVVIAACWYLYFINYGGTFVPDHFGSAGPLVSDADRALESLQRMLQDLIGQGKKVYLVLNTPIGADLDPHRMIRRFVLPPGFAVAATSPARSAVVSALNPIVSKLRKIARETGARVVDPIPWLCDQRVCPALSQNGDPIYADMWRLRPSYVRENVRFLDDIVLRTP